MYNVYCNTRLIYNDDAEELKIFNANIELELGKSGTFEFTVYPSHPFYSEVTEITSIITVYRKSDVVFRGRALNITYGFHNEKQVYCEGALAFLIDSVIPPFSYSGSFAEFLTYVLQQHNAQVEEAKQLQLGNVTVAEFSPYEVEEINEYRTTLDTLNIYMVEPSGGYLSVRYEGGVQYLDLLSYYADATTVNQSIEFGKNLLDVARETNSEDVFSCIIPLGAKIEGTETRLTISSVNSGKSYIENTDAVTRYGRIYKVVVFDGITQASTLLTEGTQYLADNYAGMSTIEISAVDLSGIDDSLESFKVGKWVKVYDEPHFSYDVQTYLIRKMTIPLLNPAGMKIIIGKVLKGITESVAESLSASSMQPYLMESGTTGIWTWKKFSDNTCEFFGKIPVTSDSITTALGGWFRGVNLYEATTYAYPFTMTEAPALNMMFQTRNGLGALVWTFSQDAETAQQYLPQCYLIRPTSGTNVTGNINIIGRGKL